jgi:hypothetical protein
MKFAALTFLTAAIANLPSSSAVFTAGDNLSPSFGEQEASLSVAEKYFSWTYSAELKGASGDISAPECIAVFGAAFVEAYNEVHVGADVQAESCSVTSVGDGPLQNDTPPLTTTGGNYYYGSGDYSCRRCGPGFAASSFEDIVKTLAVAVKGGDFENTLTAKCAASASCPAFATLTKIKVTYLSDALHAVPKVSSNAVVALGQDKKYFRKTFKVMLKYQGGSGVPTDESCFPIFDDVFVSVYNDVNAGEDTQIETCFVTSVTPGLFEKPSSVRGVSVEGGNYYYNSNGDWTCRRCGGNLQGVGGDKDLEGALLDAMVSASSACFDGLSSVKVVLNTEAANE